MFSAQVRIGIEEDEAKRQTMRSVLCVGHSYLLIKLILFMKIHYIYCAAIFRTKVRELLLGHYF